MIFEASRAASHDASSRRAVRQIPDESGKCDPEYDYCFRAMAVGAGGLLNVSTVYVDTTQAD